MSQKPEPDQQRENDDRQEPHAAAGATIVVIRKLERIQRCRLFPHIGSVDPGIVIHYCFRNSRTSRVQLGSQTNGS